MSSINKILIFVTCYMCLGTSINAVDELEPKIKSNLRSGHIFESFIETYLNILSTAFTGKELIRYCRMMRIELKRMEFTYTDRLSRHFKYLSKMHRDDIVDEVAKYRREYDNKLPKSQTFFEAIEEAFNLQHRLKFDDYIHDLLAFGKGDLLFVTIQEQTRKLLEMIVDCVHKLGPKRQRSVERALRLAIKEHLDNF